MDIVIVMFLLPIIIFVISLIAVYSFGLIAAFVMSAIAGIYFSIAASAINGFNPSGGGSKSRQIEILFIGFVAFAPFLIYLLIATYVAHLCHAHGIFWPYILFIVVSILIVCCWLYFFA